MKIADIANIDSGMPLVSVEQLLDSIQAEIYVSDVESNTLLFCNSQLRKSLGTPPAGGRRPKCFEAIYGRKSACPHCVVEQLRGTVSAPIRTTSESDGAGRIYQYTDCLIEWPGNRKAHIRYTLDVTEQTSAQWEGVKKLRHDSVISEIATQIISSNKLAPIVDDAIQKLGKQIDADRAHLLGIRTPGRIYTSTSEYVRQGVQPFAACVGNQKVPVSDHVYGQMLKGATIVEPNVAKSKKRRHYNVGKLLGAQSFIVTPVFINERLWGVLYVCMCASPHHWYEEDVAFCKQIANIVAIAIERRNKDHELLSAKETLQTILDNVPAAISWKDTSLRFLGCNKNHREIFGAVEDASIGNAASLSMPAAYAEDAAETEQEILGGHPPGEPTVRGITDPLGNERWIRTTRVPVRNEYGIVTMLLSVTEDVTSEVQLEEAKASKTDIIKRQAKYALEQSRAKSEFLSQMSHEIRTPLNTIIGMLQIALEADDKNLIKHYLHQIEPASKSLLDIINNVLDISRIEADKVDIRCEEFVFEEMLRDIFGSVGAFAEMKDIHFISQIQPQIPGKMKGDPQNIALILKNLLSNALKFTPSGGVVQLVIGVLEETDTHLTLRYEVSDTGIGLSEEKRKRLFLPFEQGDDTIVKNYGGSGLGLNLAQRVAHLLQSEITVESEAGQGSTFAFSTRLEKAMDRSPMARGKALAGIPVLVATNAWDPAPLFTAYLEACGAVVHLTDDIGHAEAPLGDSGRPRAVILDFAMSEQDEIRIVAAACATLPPSQVVFITSGPGTTEKIKSTLKAGVTHIFTRPYLYVDLANAVCDIAGINPPAAKADPDYPNYSGKTILLAEDIAVNRKIVNHFLRDTGATVVDAGNGESALQMYQETPERYDVILMDVRMPVMDGFDATVAIRAFEAEQGMGNIPIIALTANAYEKDRRRCLDAGMNSYLVKPLQKKDLIAELGKLMLSQPGTSHQPAMVANKNRHSGTAANDLMIDVEGGLERMMNDREFYLELLGDFLHADDLTRIEDAWDKKDYSDLLHHLHSLKGVAGNYGLDKLLHATILLEDTLYEKGDANDEYLQLMECFAQTNIAIAQFIQGETSGLTAAEEDNNP